jgi:hypothetical protein
MMGLRRRPLTRRPHCIGPSARDVASGRYFMRPAAVSARVMTAPTSIDRRRG